MTLALRPYQQKNLAALLACLARGESPLCVLPTAGGKTQILCSVAGDRGQEGWTIGIFVHRIELLRPAGHRLSAREIDHRGIAPRHALTRHRVHVASIDAVATRKERLTPWLHARPATGDPG